MLRNHRVSRAIADAAWGSFLATLRYKAARAGVEVAEVDARGTSQVCSGCGQVVEKSLSQRTHSCDCGLVLHRDVNAARNILAVALARTGPADANSKIIAVV
jgi:putative transposase